MLQDYKDSLKYLYKYEVAVFRFLGTYLPDSEMSNRKRLIYEMWFFVFLLFIIEYNVVLFLGVFFQPTLFDKLRNVVFVLSSMIAATAKLVCVKKHFKLYRDQVSSLYRCHFDPRKPSEFDLLNRKITESRWLRIYYGGITFAALLFILISKKITYPEELPTAVFVPFGMKSKLQFVALEFQGFFAISTMCFMNTAFDMWYVSLLIFAHGQLELLEHRLRNIGEDAKSDRQITTELKMCIHHHAEIYKFVESLERAINVPASIQVMCTLLVLSCNFYAMAFISIHEDLIAFIKFFIYQMTMLAQIFLICFYPNEVSLASNRMPFALYSTDWTAWSKENRRLVLLTILRFQSPIVVRPINRCYCFDLATFSSIVNSSYSYFTLLKQMKN